MRTAPDCGSRQLSQLNCVFFSIILFHRTSTTPQLSSPYCKPLRHHWRSSGAASPHQRQWLHRAAAGQRPRAPAPSPVPVAASRGHRRWSLLPPQENGVGSIPSSVQHGDDQSSLLGRRFAFCILPLLRRSRRVRAAAACVAGWFRAWLDDSWIFRILLETKRGIAACLPMLDQPVMWDESIWRWSKTISALPSLCAKLTNGSFRVWNELMMSCLAHACLKCSSKV